LGPRPNVIYLVLYDPSFSRLEVVSVSATGAARRERVRELWVGPDKLSVTETAMALGGPV